MAGRRCGCVKVSICVVFVILFEIVSFSKRSKELPELSLEEEAAQDEEVPQDPEQEYEDAEEEAVQSLWQAPWKLRQRYHLLTKPWPLVEPNKAFSSCERKYFEQKQQLSERISTNTI